AFTNPGSIDDMPSELLNVTDRELHEVKDDLLQENVNIIRRKYNIPVSGRVIEGLTSKIIYDTAAQSNADVIVMGMKGKGKSNSIFGSTTTTLIRRCEKPVMVIPEGAGFTSLHHITLAADLVRETLPVQYEFLRKLAVRSDSFIHILNVRIKKVELSTEEATETMSLSQYLSGIRHEFFSIIDDDVDDGIEDFMDMHPSDLLVMFSRKRNFFERLFSKSNTREVSEDTRIPLLVLQS